MKVEIWSDIVCPFCYIGKRRFENALEEFSGKSDVTVQWRSFQLSPDTKYLPGKTIHEVLAEKKGWTTEEARRMNEQVSAIAANEGLNYQFDKTIPANTFNAHRLTHLAAKYNLQQQAEEKLFAAYFTEGKNLEDKHTLAKLGSEIGLDENEVSDMLSGDAFTEEVETDSYEAQQIGVRGVPFFVIDRKFAVSGAQPKEVFLKALETAKKRLGKRKFSCCCFKRGK